MNLPNRLTIVRIVLVPLYMLLMLLDFPFHYVAALTVFAIAALTDYFDGKIARSQGLVTNLGKFLDPIADKMLTTAAFAVLLQMGYTDVWAVMLVLTREFMVTSVRLMAAGSGKVVAASFFGKLKTVSQYVAIIVMMVALQWQDIVQGWLPTWPEWLYTVPVLVSQILIWISAILTVASGIQYFWQFREYFSEKC